MTKREVEEYLVHLAPKPAVSSGVRKSPVSDPASANPAAADTATPSKPAPRKPGSAEPCQPDVYNLRFAVDKGFLDKLLRAAEVGGIRNARRNMAQVFERALDVYLEKNDPKQRQERREERAARKAAAEKATVEPVAPEDTRGVGGVERVERSRTIPTPRRDRLLIRAGHRCEYRGSDGVRCSERSHLTIDHIEPFGLGGTSEERNLRVYCFAHNRLYADRCFGVEFMNRKIELARSVSSQTRRLTSPRLSATSSGRGREPRLG